MDLLTLAEAFRWAQVGFYFTIGMVGAFALFPISILTGVSFLFVAARNIVDLFR